MEDYDAKTLRLIAEAKATDAPDLHLSSLRLTHVPPEITNLTHLRRLYRSENPHLSDITLLAKLPKLQTL
jgi:Leucine-rich repeat (LRR) protein